MRSQIMALRVAGLIFALLCFGQVIRLVMQPEVMVAGHNMPLWPSAVAVVVLAGLSTWMWSSAQSAR